MKQCPFCHEMIDEQETLCPYCGTVQDELSQPVSIEPNEGVQTDLLDENNEPNSIVYNESRNKYSRRR